MVDQLSPPVRSNDPFQLRRDIADIELTYSLIHPRGVKAMLGLVLNGATDEILPEPPIGFGWLLNGWKCGNPNAGGGTATYTIRANGAIVDKRTIAVSTMLQTNPMNGVMSEGPVTINCSAGTSVAFVGTASLVALTHVRSWVSPALTDTYQTLTLPDIPEDHALCAPMLNAAGSIGWNWHLNTDGSSRVPRIRITRGGVQYEITGGTTGTDNRANTPIPILPPIVAGDTLEARITTTPAADTNWIGGLFTVVPLIE